MIWLGHLLRSNWCSVVCRLLFPCLPITAKPHLPIPPPDLNPPITITLTSPPTTQTTDTDTSTTTLVTPHDAHTTTALSTSSSAPPRPATLQRRRPGVDGRVLAGRLRRDLPVIRRDWRQRAVADDIPHMACTTTNPIPIPAKNSAEDPAVWLGLRERASARAAWRVMVWKAALLPQDSDYENKTKKARKTM